MARVRGGIAASVLLAVSLLGPASHAGGSSEGAQRADRQPAVAAADDSRRTRAAARLPRLRIGQLIKRKRERSSYRFMGRKGQRVILQGDGWPKVSHGCITKQPLKLRGKDLPQGPIGDWRLPRTATYVLHVGPACAKYSLRLRRYEKPWHEVGEAELPTTFTPTLMRSVRLKLPVGQPVILELAEGSGEEQEDLPTLVKKRVFVTNARARAFPFVGCNSSFVTAGGTYPCGPGRLDPRVVVSAPTASRVVEASVVEAAVDGPAVTLAEPTRTLVRVAVPNPTALRVESNAVPVPHALAERDWIELWTSIGSLGLIDTYRTRVSDDTWLPSGWVPGEAGSYFFQVVDPASVPAGEPMTLAVRTSVNPPPGETPWDPYSGDGVHGSKAY